MEENDIIRSCPLFAGLDDGELGSALALYHAEREEYKKGEALANAGDRLDKFGLVLSGGVQVGSNDIDGGLVIMNVVQAGGTFGESLCWLKVREIPVRITAISDTTVLHLSPEFIRRDGDALTRELSQRFISMLASRTLAMNDRIQVLSRISLREKLLVFFTQCSRGGVLKNFEIPFNRESLAVYLGVNRASLSRELSAMKRDGIIDYYRNSFRII